MNLEKFEMAIEYLENAINVNSRNELSRSLLQDAMELWCVDVNVVRDEELDCLMEYKGETDEDFENCLKANSFDTPFPDESKNHSSVINSSNLQEIQNFSTSGPPKVNHSGAGTDMSLEEESLDESSLGL